MADLSWFPVFVADWLTSDDVTLMLPEQEGAFFRLLLRAWGKGGAEPSLPAVDRDLAILSRLGRRWAKLGPLVRAQFTERDGRLYNERLSTVWTEQQSKHERAIDRGRIGGRTKADNAKNNSSLARDTVQHTEKEAVVSTPNSVEKQQPAAPSALAPVGAALPAAKNGKGNPNGLANLAAVQAADAETTKEAQRAAVKAEQEKADRARANPQATRAAEEAEKSMRKALFAEFDAKVSDKYDAWKRKDPAGEAGHEAHWRKELKMTAAPAVLGHGEATFLRRTLLYEWRKFPENSAIPEPDQYVVQELAKRSAQPRAESPSAMAHA